MNFVFFYTEISEYLLACCSELTKKGNVHIIRWPLNKEAPFQFRTNERIKTYTKTDYNFNQLKQLVASINPDAIICSGWIDKDYLKITKPYFKKIPTIMTCDTHWRGTLKQYIATLISRFTLLRIFSHAWVPGQIQKKYVLNLGFRPEKIELGFYSCDLPLFESIYQSQKEQKHINFPKRFLYVGRYYDYKGVIELFQAFIDFQNEEPNEWELWCLGIGDVPPAQHPKIKHFGFVQPKDMATYTSKTGVFILPSRADAWGLVVHEFTASGFPILLSDQVGAKEQFLIESKNGFEFKARNVPDLVRVLKKTVSLKESELIEMSKYSNVLSKTISPQSWVESLIKMANSR